MSQVPPSSHGGSLPDPITAPVTISPGNEADTPLTLRPGAGASADGYYAFKILDDAGNLMGYVDATGSFSLAPASANAGSTTFAFDSYPDGRFYMDGGSFAIFLGASGGFSVITVDNIAVIAHSPSAGTECFVAAGSPFTIRSSDDQALFQVVDTRTLAIGLTDSLIGFFGETPAVKPEVTGAKAGNAALASLLTALADLGLVTDSTT